MTGFMPPVRKTQVQSGEPNNLRVGFGDNAAGNSGRRRVAAAPGTLAYTKPENPPTRL